MTARAQKAPENLDDAWIQTYTGRKISLLHPHPEDVDIIDIAQSLSKICRFGGHCQRFFSVAEHSVLVSFICQGNSGRARQHIALQGLLHDAAEAYIGDIVSPLKKLLPAVTEIEDKWLKAIGEAFGVGLSPLPDEVKQADLISLRLEVIDLMPPGLASEWRKMFPDEVCIDRRSLKNHDIEGSQPIDAYNIFMARFMYLQP